METRLPLQPYKGARDFYPEDMQVRNYIFEKWRKVCKRYGYEEYDGPFVESFEIYAAKTGEEIVNQQLYSFTDRGERKVAIRPEMTPTLARMVAQKFNELPQPIRWFSIPNLWRYEKPQKGRLREHFQLNVDIFGVNGILADFEVLSLATSIMHEFGANDNMYQIKVGNRRLIDDVMNSMGMDTEQKYKTGKILDRKAKLSAEDFTKLLTEEAKLSTKQLEAFKKYLDNPTPTIAKLKETSTGAREVFDLIELVKKSGLENVIKYDPTIMRGFDYYTGNVFEQFDMSPDNNRSMYGGGRYDDLVDLFIGKKLSGIGFGMGDVTFRIFLENWGLLPKFSSESEYLVTLWPEESEKFIEKSFEIANFLRQKGKNVQTWLEPATKLDKQLKHADKKSIRYVIIIGENELKTASITLKDMLTQNQKTISITDFFTSIA